MQPESKTAVLEALAKLDEVRNQVTALLSPHPELSSIQLRLEMQLQTLTNSVKAMVGVAPDSQQPTDKLVFGPVQMIDGHTVGEAANEVREADIHPQEEETENLKSRILDLEEALKGGYTNEQVLSNFVTDADRLVVRGLAKKSGHPEFATAEIDEEFLNKVREGLGQKEETETVDKVALIALINEADTKEKVEELAKGNDDEEVQDAALNRIIALEDNPQ